MTLIHNANKVFWLSLSPKHHYVNQGYHCTIPFLLHTCLNILHLKPIITSVTTIKRSSSGCLHRQKQFKVVNLIFVLWSLIHIQFPFSTYISKCCHAMWACTRDILFNLRPPPETQSWSIYLSRSKTLWDGIFLLSYRRCQLHSS